MKRSLLITGAVAALLTSGCEQIFQKGSERKYKEAILKADLEDYQQALMLYEAALDGTPDSAGVHYQMGLIYDDKLKQPFSAIHHFQRYLDLAPDGIHAQDARNFIKEDKLKLASMHGTGATVPQQEAVRLKNENLELRKQLLVLRKELDDSIRARLADLKGKGGSGGKGGKGQFQKPLISGIRTYTVESGDTLGSISRKFYRTPDRWQDIQEVNFNTTGTARLQPGMVIMVP